MEPQKPGNSPGPEPKVVEGQSRQSASGAKSPQQDSAELDERRPGMDDHRRCMKDS